MFEEKTYKMIIFTLLQGILLVVLFAGYIMEFISYFLVSDSFTFMDLPLESASIIEFILFTILSGILCVIAIILIRIKKMYRWIEHLICISIISLNILKLIYFIPSMALHQTYLFYTIKKLIPLITSSLPILFGYIKISEIKYEKYR